MLLNSTEFLTSKLNIKRTKELFYTEWIFPIGKVACNLIKPFILQQNNYSAKKQI